MDIWAFFYLKDKNTSAYCCDMNIWTYLDLWDMDTILTPLEPEHMAILIPHEAWTPGHTVFILLGHESQE